MFKFVDFLTIEFCKNNPSYFVVFGDNLLRKGKKGQAIIRDEPNSYGIPTKRLPSMGESAFFSDKGDEYLIVKDCLVELWDLHLQNETIVLPENAVGSGLADLKNKSPIINKLVERFWESARVEESKILIDEKLKEFDALGLG